MKYSKNQGHRTSAHDAVRDLLIAFLRQCHFQDIRWEVKNWDHTAGPNVKEGQRRVPDIICTDPYNNTVYIIDVRIAWNLSTSGGGDGEYYTGKLAKEAEHGGLQARGRGKMGPLPEAPPGFQGWREVRSFRSRDLGRARSCGEEFLRRRAAVDSGDPRRQPLPLDGTVV